MPGALHAACQQSLGHSHSPPRRRAAPRARTSASLGTFCRLAEGGRASSKVVGPAGSSVRSRFTTAAVDGAPPEGQQVQVMHSLLDSGYL